MLLLNNLICLNLALTAEMFVLVLALFFIAYVSKNQLHKWFRYAGIAAAVLMAGIMICSLTVHCCKKSCKQQSACGMYAHGCAMKAGCMKGGEGHCKGDMNKSCRKEKAACQKKDGMMADSIINAEVEIEIEEKTK